ncbi:MAG: choice-of-anchor B family protein [bacterium]|nr:choice-of-anchor B family protein [bacterium]
MSQPTSFTAWRVGAVIGLCTLTPPLLAHDDDPKLLDRQPSIAGSGYRPAPGTNPTTSQALGFDSSGVQLQSWLTMADLGVPGEEGNDCWGYTSPSGREYALMGTSTDTTFVEITTPTNPQVIGHISGPGSIWRDIKVFGDRAYIVSEGGGGIQVVSLTNIDAGSVSLLGAVGSGSTHNIAIDETSGFAYRTGGGSTGLRIYDLNANPNAPPFVGQWNTRYVHDAQIVTYTSGPLAGKQIAYCCAGLNGGGTDTALTILDVTNKGNIIQLSQVPYPNREYSHQGWLSEDRQYFYLGDELDEPPLDSTTHVFDVSDPSNASYVSSFDNGNAAITHNFYVKGGLLYEANYRSGMRVFDLSNPTNPSEIAFFDTYPGSDSASFNGLWSLFPYFDSGTVIGSDVERGLFVWRVNNETVAINIPGGPPSILSPSGDTVDVTITEGAPGDLSLGSETLHYSTGGGFTTSPLTNNGGGNYTANFPAIDCGTGVSWYISAETVSGNVFTSPDDAPGTTYTSVSAVGVTNFGSYDMESNAGWSSGMPGDTATTGIWTRGNPNGTDAQPEDDHSPAPGTDCWFTGQAAPGAGNGSNDVDGGVTTLLSPVLALAGTSDPTISYWRWYSNNQGTVDDIFVIDITDNGSTWLNVETLGPNGPDVVGGWIQHSFRLLDVSGLNLTNQIQMRFVASDLGSGSIVEAAIDDFSIDELICDTGLGTPYCAVVLNSIGLEGRLTATGSAVAADNDVTLEATQLPPNQFGYFLAAETQGFIATPGGSVGNFCLGQPTARFNQQILDSGPTGQFSSMIDLTNIPLSPPQAVVAGETWNFQGWYRDFLVFQTSNFTNGYEIVFQ